MKRGNLLAIGAYLIWGFMPVYIKLLKSVAPLQILGHRIVWSFLLLLLVLLALRQMKGLRQALSQGKSLLIYAVASLLLAANWLTYIFAVNSERVVESSLGYFINPLVSVVFGVVFFREKLRPAQWLAVGIATAGVAYLTWEYGRLPYVALALAGTFGLYGLVKKVAPLGALHGLTLETAILFLPAMGYLAVVAWQGEGAFGAQGLGFDLLLAFAGVVTAVPLLMFGAAARQIPLSMVGIFQYIAPTCQFLLGVLAYHESFSGARLVGFGVIWVALVLFWGEGYVRYRRTRTHGMAR